MADNAIDDQYFTYEGRLASFQKTTKKRASAAGGRGAKALNWPHKRITPASLANAGFFFNPTPDHPDNVVCFLCHKGLDGWEEGDDPLHEHLSHTSGCGWATLAAIEAELGDYHLGDPSAPEMVAARKATFAGRWPHDSKRGWKCKTKQLVDSGWKYTPTPESDDMATCVYCQLALDGWEPSDKPLDEHYKRAPNCPFFTLASQTHGKKSSRSKVGRASKASRTSIQSTITAPSEIGSVDELTAMTNDDTVLTTTSTMTAGGKKPRAKKAATTKGRKTRAKKEEAMEPEEAQPPVDDDPTPQPSPPKPKRGKKRSSDAVEESTLTVADAPAPKKRATRSRVSKTVDGSVIEPTDTVMEEQQQDIKKPAARKKGRPSKVQTGRKTSTASRASTLSLASSHAETIDLLDDDDEIERQLQADLERPLTDDEDIMADSDSERFKAKAKTAKKPAKTSTAKSTEFAMLDPQPVEADDGAVEDELKQLEAEMQVDEPEQLEVPKKGRKAGTRKASKQTKPKKAKAAPPPEPESEPELEEVPLEDEAPEEHHRSLQEDSVGSTDTVVRNTQPAAAKKPRGRPPKASMASVMSQDELDDMQLVEEPFEEEDEEPQKETVEPQPPVKRPRGRPSKASLASRASSQGEASMVNTSQGPVKRPRGRPPKKVEEKQFAESPDSKPVAKAQPRKVSRTKKAPAPEPEPEPVVDELVHDDMIEDEIFEEPSSPVLDRQPAPATPPRAITKAQSAKQATVSPSPSPQSSDAENQPPSSKPSATTTKRIPLAPVSETPKAMSPSKRNIIAGLQSSTPWTAVDIDAMLGTPGRVANKENGTERLIKKGKELTSPEKEMTVEEWVYYNAGQAEKMLKQECEAMVSRFESEGARAMNVLEGLVVD